MRILTNDELDFVRRLDAPGQYKMEVAFHEAGHGLMVIHYGGVFGQIVCDLGDKATPGFMTGFTLPNGNTARQVAAIALGGWAATQILCYPVQMDFFHGPQFEDDALFIRDTLRLSLDQVIETQSQVIKIMTGYVSNLKEIAFRLMETGALDFSEVNKIMKPI